MPNGDKLRPKNTREHLLAIYGYITGLRKDVKHMHEGIHNLGGKIDKIYWVLLGTVGAVSLLLLEKVKERRELIRDQKPPKKPQAELPAAPFFPDPEIANLFAANVNQTTGLTDTETALLSPEEQIIARRLRT